MNGINRRGQKVICVQEIEIVYADDAPVATRVPEVDAVYTVSDFIDLSDVFHDPIAWPGITLAELPMLIRKRSTGVRQTCGWPIICFRPRDERETDIGELWRAANDVPTSGPEAERVWTEEPERVV